MRGYGCTAHPAFPAPSLEGRARPLHYWGERMMQNSGGSCREKAMVCPPSFRGDAKHRTRNLEIPGLVLTHHPGMTEVDCFATLAMTGCGCSSRKSGGEGASDLR